jgi:N-acyl-D-amino-acid deacylase
MKTRKTIRFQFPIIYCIVLCLVVFTGGMAQAADYDVVILNGRVMDPETDFDGVRNVGIKDGKIAVITENAIEGKETIDAKGLVVAPGFIDTQTHATNDWGYKVSLRDGVTSVMDTEVGAINVGKWYAARKGKTQANYGTVVSQEYARMIVLDGMEITEPMDAVQIGVLRGKTSEKDGVDDWAVTVSSLEQMNAITKILDENLRQGAIGVGSTIGYMAKGVSTYEMFEAQRAAARYGRLTGAHVRHLGNTSPPVEGTLGFDEVFANAVALKAPLIASHNNNYGWWEVQEKLTLAREQGYNMWGEHYPYTAGSSTIGSEFLKPEYYPEIFGPYEETMLNPQTGKFMTEEE